MMAGDTALRVQLAALIQTWEREAAFMSQAPNPDIKEHAATLGRCAQALRALVPDDGE
jgi:hypothetical protein